MTQLIGLSGAKRSGKNTVSTILKDLVDGTVREVSFASKLKAAAARALGFQGTEEELVALMDDCKENWQFAITTTRDTLPHPNAFPNIGTTFFSGREYLQWFGTEAGRQTFGDNFWVDLVLPDPLPLVQGGGWVDAAPSQALALRYSEDYVVVTDARFPNEAQRVKALGGVVWEVVRPGTGGDGHVSETPLPRELVDLTISNTGTLEELRAKVELALATI